MKKRYTHIVGIACVLMAILSLCNNAYSRTLHVSKQELAGIQQTQQFRTIGEAALLAEPGDMVIIDNGVYREKVDVEKSGLAEKPITFQAAVGANVVMTGADRITEWTEVQGPGHIYSTPWPHKFITWNKEHTHPNDDFHLLIGRCEQVFVSGFALRQVLERDKLARGTFYVDLDGERLYIWNYDNQDISSKKVIVEASARDTILSVKGNHVVIKGIRFRYAANRAQHGAVEFSGNNLTVEDCVFEKTNSSGASFRGEDITVRRCTFQNNGQLGFGASRAHRLLITGCIVRNNNIKEYDRGWEAGGNKICLARGVVLENSTFIENHGNGIWFDIGNENCAVRNCLIADNDDAGIFYEISYGLHAHDNVIVGNGFAGTSGAWGASAGISISSSANCFIERNLLLGNKEGFNLREQTRSTPRIEDRKSVPIWNQNHKVHNNVIAYNRDAQTWGWFDVSDNRHWPAKEGKAEAGGLTLEKLSLDFSNNLYRAAPGQDLFNWGVTWKDHKRYKKLDEVRESLNLEQSSRTADVVFKDFSALDLRVTNDSPAIQMQCYPQGDIPDVQLGMHD